MVDEPTSLLKPDDYEWSWADFDDWKNSKCNFSREIVIEQEEIIRRNLALLLDSEAWQQKTDAFLTLLEKLEDKNERNIQRCTFKIIFLNAIFANELNCDEFKFPCSTFFQGAEFKRGVGFNGTVFHKHVFFSNATFQSAGFNQVRFNGTVSFDKATFNGDARFDKAIIHFLSAWQMKVEENLYISSKIKNAEFNRIVVRGTASFSGSEFENVPNFRDSKFDFPPEVADMILPPPKMSYLIKNKRGNNVKVAKFLLAKYFDDVAKYRKLKAMALSANDHEKDGEFFAYEMMAKRGHETTGFFPLLLNSLYKLLSFYGQSIARPLIWMFVSFVAFWVGGLAMIKVMTGSLQEIGFAAVHSALNSMPLIGTLFRTTSVPEGHISWYDDTYHQLVDNGLSPDWWAAISAGQQIIGAVLFFLLFLGFRNKFRLK